MIGQTISHYRVLEKLGEGGMGVVYAAADTHLGRRVAIKFLTATSDQHYRARFLREARSVSLLSHANIATVFDYGETPEGQPYIVMEFVRGKTLADLLAENAVSLRRSAEIAASVADALSEAHHHGIVHRDIKPANIVVTDRGQVKVLDFGLAKQLYEEQFFAADGDAKTLFATRTRSEVVVGTPLYLSPEQATGGKVDGRSDLFALGAMLYECVAGRSAFSGSSIIEIGAQVLHVDPPPPSTVNSRVPTDLDRIIMKALAKKADDRYQTAAELASDLKAIAGSLPAGEGTTRAFGPVRATHPSAFLTTFNEAFKRPRVSLGFFAVALVVAVSGIWLVLHFWRPSPYKPSVAAQGWYEKGTSALRNGAYYQASKAFEEAIKADARYALAHARLAEAWVELDYADRARTELLRANQLVGDRAVLSALDALYFDAISAVATPDFPRAIELYKQIVSQDSSPSAYLDLARAYEKNDQTDEAIKSCLEATNRDRDFGSAFLRLGILYQRKRDTKSASAAYERADTLFQAQGNIEGRIELLLRRGSLMRELGKLAEAKTLLQQSIDLAGANNSELPKINGLIEMGRVAYAEGATGQAENYQKQAIDFAEQHGLETPMVRSLIYLGNTFLAKGDYDQADKNFNLALGVAERNKSPYLENLSLANIGTLRYYQLRTDESLQLAQKALDFFQSGGYRAQVMFAMITVARATRRKGDFDSALHTLEQRLQLARQADDRRQVAVTYGEMGFALFQREHYPEALDQYSKAAADFQQLGDRLNLAYNLMNRGNILWRLGRYQESAEALHQASELANRPEGKYEPVLTEIELINAQIALSQRNFADAKLRSRRVLSTSPAPEDVTIDAEYTLGLAEAFSGAGADGERLCKEAVDAAGKIGDVALLSRAQLALAEVQLIGGNARSALATATEPQKRLALTGQQESQWRAWAIAARASRALHDETSARQQLTQATALLSRLEQSWRAEDFSHYTERPDIRVLLQQSGMTSTGPTTSTNQLRRNTHDLANSQRFARGSTAYPRDIC
jgi:tetratricopeptide (TPR) repeat protein/predicted Ser/Thr protein kinase